MLSSRVISFVLFFLTFGLAFAIPAPVEKRADPAQVQTVLNTLRSNINGPLAELSTIAADGSGTDANVTPRLESIIRSLDQAGATLESLNRVATREVVTFDKRQSNNQVASQLASIIQDVTGTVNAVEKSKPPGHFPKLPDHIKLIDGGLGKIVLAVEILLVGVIKLLSGLLLTLSVLLKGLSFTLLTVIFGFK